MRHLLISVLCLSIAGVSSAQEKPERDEFNTPNRLAFESGNEMLAAGSRALRTGDYQEGIRLTHLGLERSGNSAYERTTALSNLCAAYAATGEPDEAIRFCSESLVIDEKNWHALSNRAYAHWLKGMHEEAASDLEAAAAINPGAREIETIRGMINQSTLRPRVDVEARQ
jgi:tetratricopeptide (TPR) repeat protein